MRPQIMRLRLILPMPPSANTLYTKGDRIALAPDHRAWRDLCAYTCIAGRVIPTSERVAVRIDLYRKRKTGDIDNRAKTILDGLNGLVWHDDKQVDWLLMRRYDDPGRPRVEISVWDNTTRREPWVVVDGL